MGEAAGEELSELQTYYFDLFGFHDRLHWCLVVPTKTIHERCRLESQKSGDDTNKIISLVQKIHKLCTHPTRNQDTKLDHVVRQLILSTACKPHTTMVRRSKQSLQLLNISIEEVMGLLQDIGPFQEALEVTLLLPNL